MAEVYRNETCTALDFPLTLLWHCLQALTHLLQCPTEHCTDSIELAIETVAQSRDSSLTSRLIEFLLGDTDGVAKVLAVISFKCHM